MKPKHRGSTGKTARPLCLSQLSLPLQTSTYQEVCLLPLAPPLAVLLDTFESKMRTWGWSNETCLLFLYDAVKKMLRALCTGVVPALTPPLKCCIAVPLKRFPPCTTSEDIKSSKYHHYDWCWVISPWMLQAYFTVNSAHNTHTYYRFIHWL